VIVRISKKSLIKLSLFGLFLFLSFVFIYNPALAICCDLGAGTCTVAADVVCIISSNYCQVTLGGKFCASGGCTVDSDCYAIVPPKYSDCFSNVTNSQWMNSTKGLNTTNASVSLICLTQDCLNNITKNATGTYMFG
jgi:hypothetical protein